jgi:hypothetical protein
MSLDSRRSPVGDGEFPISRRGYSPRHVEDYVRLLDARLGMVSADHDALLDERARLRNQVERLAGDCERLRERVRELSAEPVRSESVSARVRVILQLATEQAAQIRAQLTQHTRFANEQAELDRRRARQLRRQLESDRAVLAARYADACQLMDRARRHSARIAAEARADAERTRADARAECRRDDEDAAARRAEADRKCERELAARRSEVAVELQQTLELSRMNTAGLLARARRQATTVIGAARRNAAAVSEAAADERVEANRVLAQTREQARRLVTEAASDAERLRATARAQTQQSLSQAQQSLAQAREYAQRVTQAARDREQRLRATETLLRDEARALSTLVDQQLAQLGGRSGAGPLIVPAQRAASPSDVEARGTRS